MSASSERYEDSVQILDNVLDAGLLEKAAASLQAGSRTAPDAVTTTMGWTSACEELLEYFRKQVHPKAITQPEIAKFVKTAAEPKSTFKMVERVNPAAQNQLSRRIRPPTDHHTLIPLVIEGLPPWIEVQSTKERRKVPWAMGSVVYLKGGTDLVCSEEGGGVYILLGGKNKATK